MTSSPSLSLDWEEKHGHGNSKTVIGRVVLICVIHRRRFRKVFQEQEDWILGLRSEREIGPRRNEANCCDTIGFH